MSKRKTEASYNLSILFQCLFGKWETHNLKKDARTTGNMQAALYDFVHIHVARVSRVENREVPDDMDTHWPYVAGWYYKKQNRGKVPDYIEKHYNDSLNNDLADYEMDKELKAFYDKYYVPEYVIKSNFKTNYHQGFVQPYYFDFLKTALKNDSRTVDKDYEIICSLHKENDGKITYEWFKAAYLAALVPEENYFGDKNAYNDIFDEIYNKTVKELNLGPPKSGAEEAISKPEHIIAIYHQYAQNYFNKVKTSGRFKTYDLCTSERQEAYISDVSVTLTHGDNENLSLEDILFNNEDPEECIDSVCLCGKGGIGKTFLLLQMIERIFEDDKYGSVIPFYIELNYISDKDHNSNIFNALLDRIKKELNEIFTEDEFKVILRKLGNRVIIFADGMNEVIGDNLRKSIMNSITNLRKEYNTRFCVSSRENHVATFNNMGSGNNGRFKDASVNELNAKQIQDYLDASKCNVKYSELLPATQGLLKTPQGVSMYSELKKSDSTRDYSFKNLGELILAYSDMILGIDRNNLEYGDLEFENVLMEIAYDFVNESKFQKEITKNQAELIAGKKKLKRIFMPKGDGKKYTFSHQNFRDVYCARFLAGKIKQICEPSYYNCSDDILDAFFYSTSIVVKNDEILQLVSAFVTETDDNNNLKEYDKEAIRVIGAMKGKERDFALSTLIKIHAFRSENGKNIADLDFSGLDLRNVSLSGFEMYNAKTEESTIFRKCKLSVDTFRRNGLQSTARFIAKYKLHNPWKTKEKEYIAVFAESSAVIIDTENNLWQTITYMSNGGVECYCVSEENGFTVIYLGHTNGSVTAFLPHMLEIDRDHAMQIRFENLDKTEAITSICEAKYEGDDIIIFSNEKGGIYFIEKYSTVKRYLHKIIPDKLDNDIGRCFIIPCVGFTRWNYEDYLIVSHCKKIYIIPFDGFPSNSNHENLQMKCFIPNEDGYEICEFNEIVDMALYDDYLLVNDRKTIGIFKMGDYDGSPALYLKAFLNASDISPNIDTLGFTRFSPCDSNDREIKIITGLSIRKQRNETNQIKRFYELTYDINKNKLTFDGFANTITDTATLRGVKYKSGNRTYFASISYSSNIEIDCLDDENIARTIIQGAYSEVNSIDILINDSYHTMVVGKSDGSVVYLPENNNTISFNSEFYIDDVYPLHEAAINKVMFFDDENFITCGKDGRLLYTEINTHETKLLMFCHEPLIDFCLDKHNSIWVISDRKVYKLEYTNFEWDAPQAFAPAGVDQGMINITAIAIDDEDDSPTIFFNTGYDTQGHFVKVTNAHSAAGTDNAVSEFDAVDILELLPPQMNIKYWLLHINNYKSPSIYKMQYHHFEAEDQTKKFLIAIGDIGGHGYILIAHDDGSESGKMESLFCEIFDDDIIDFTVTNDKDNIILWAAHIESVVSTMSLNINELLNKSFVPEIIRSKTSNQALCLKNCDNRVLYGGSNGDIGYCSNLSFRYTMIIKKLRMEYHSVQ